MCTYMYFCSCVLIFVMLCVIHVDGHGVVMISCTPSYRRCSIANLVYVVLYVMRNHRNLFLKRRKSFLTVHYTMRA